MDILRHRGVEFEWDVEKEIENLVKHGVDFTVAQSTFSDSARLILADHWGGLLAKIQETL